MKKLFSFMLVVLVVASSLCFSASATEVDSTDSVVQPQYKYKEKFSQWTRCTEYDPELGVPEGVFGRFFDYGELYEHKDESGNVEWALISAKLDLPNPWEVVETVRIGNRILKWWTPGAAACSFGYVVYDAKLDKFIDLGAFKENVYNGYDVDDYDGLKEAFDELDIGGKIGDVDMDKSVTVLDATEIQLYLSQLKQWAREDYSYIPALGDVDEDGDMTVLDATTIQLNLAQIDEDPVDESKDAIYTDHKNEQFFDTMPKDVVSLDFESLDLPAGGLGQHNDSHHFVALVRSKAQYDKLFNIDNKYFDDEFFKTKSLVVAVIQGTDYYSYADVIKVSVKDNKLYVDVAEGINSPYPDMGFPVAPLLYSFVAVDKTDVENIEYIERARSRFEFKEPYNYDDDSVWFSKGVADYTPTLEKFAPYGVVDIRKVDSYSFVLTLEKHDVNNVIEVVKALQDDEELCLFYFSPVFLSGE